jgi:4-hydroxy-tetrahydrodipicolinate synthase
MHELCMASIGGNLALANDIQRRLLPLHKALFVEANPIPVKWAVARMGKCRGALRLPMTPLTPANQPVLEAALSSLALI